MDTHFSKEVVMKIYEKIKQGKDYKKTKKEDLIILSPENQKDIKEWAEYLLASIENKERSYARVAPYLHYITRIAMKYGKSLRDIHDRKTIDNLLLSFYKDKELSAHTKAEIRSTLKQFYRWLRSEENSEYLQMRGLYPPEVQHLQSSVKKRDYPILDSNSIPTDEEFNAVLHQTTNPMDKAIIAVMFECAYGVSDILSRKIKHVIKDNNNLFMISGQGKAGVNMRHMLNVAVPFVVEWLKAHPHKDDPEAPFCCKYDRKTGQLVPLSYINLLNILHRAYTRASIDYKARHWDGYTLRHYRKTFLMRNNVSDKLICKMTDRKTNTHDWVYDHLVPSDIDAAYNTLYGKSDDKITYCPKCGKGNTVGSLSCSTCANNLNKEVDLSKEVEELKLKVNNFSEVAKKFDKLEEVIKQINSTH